MRWPPGQWISTTSAERICRFSDVGVRASRTAQRLPSLSLISRTYIHCADLLEERLQTSNIFAREPKSTLDGIKTKNTEKQHPTTHHYCCVGGIAREFMDRLNPDLQSPLSRPPPEGAVRTVDGSEPKGLVSPVSTRSDIRNPVYIPFRAHAHLRPSGGHLTEHRRGKQIRAKRLFSSPPP